MTDFIVRFENVKLTHEATQHLQKAIGAAVDAAMAQAAFTPDPEGDGTCVFIPRRWLGRWIIPQAALNADVGILNAQLHVTAQARET